MKDSFSPLNKFLIILTLSAFLVLAIIFSSHNYVITLLLLGLISIILLFFLKPIFGLYLIALFLPVTGLAFQFKSLELPLIDLLSLVVLIAFIVQHLYFYFFSYQQDNKIKFPLGGAFLVFFIMVLLSSFFNDNILGSLWYACRWILFFYLAFIVLPFNTIKDLKTLKRVLIIISLGGLLVASMGLSSLFLQDWSDSFFRVRPLYIFGDWIFGENYNLLAEFLIIATFIVLSLKYWFKSVRQKKIINLIAIAFIFTNFLTFGRTAWIIILLQLILFFSIDTIIKRKKISLQGVVLSLFFFLILISPFFIKMLSLQEANISSTQNRFLLTQISWSAFLEKPFLGHGSGSFVGLVGNNIRFVAKYGDPLDSHGFGQKILAENGILGLLAFLVFLFLIFKKIYSFLINNRIYYELILPLFIASLGGYFYQIFNTSYYKGRVWLPIALALVAIEIISKDKKINN